MAVTIPRVQLFEINDAEWVPRVLRDTIIDTLSQTMEWGRILGELAPPFEAFVAAAGVTEILDLGAGAGGPARILAAEIARAGRTPPRFILTDIHPREDAWAALHASCPETIDFVSEPVDATRIPPRISAGRARMIVNAFHHFPPEIARRILADAVESAAPIFISEAFDRNPVRFASFTPAGVASLAAQPILSSRDRLTKALLIWFSPVAAMVSIWDGMVSILRVYTEAELRAMVAPLGGGYAWTYGTYDYPFGGRGFYFHGVPRR